MPRHNYSREKLSQALASLASVRPPRDRLEAAFAAFAPLEATDFADPKDGYAFAEVHALMTLCEATGDEGTVRATLEQATDDDMNDLMRRILALHHSVHRGS